MTAIAFALLGLGVLATYSGVTGIPMTGIIRAALAGQPMPDGRVLPDAYDEPQREYDERGLPDIEEGGTGSGGSGGGGGAW